MTSAPSGAPVVGRLGAQHALEGVVLLALEGLLVWLGWTSGIDQPAFWIAYRGSATVGVLLVLALLVAGLSRSVGAVDTLCVVTAVRAIAVPLALVMLGWSTPAGRGDPTFVTILMFGTLFAVAGFVLAIVYRRRLRAGPAVR